MKCTIHIGQQIQQRLKQQGQTVTWLSGQLHCDRSSVHRIFLKNYIDTQTLFRISIAMNYDFFKDFSSVFKEMQMQEV